MPDQIDIPPPSEPAQQEPAPMLDVHPAAPRRQHLARLLHPHRHHRHRPPHRHRPRTNRRTHPPPLRTARDPRSPRAGAQSQRKGLGRRRARLASSLRRTQEQPHSSSSTSVSTQKPRTQRSPENSAGSSHLLSGTTPSGTPPSRKASYNSCRSKRPTPIRSTTES